MRANISITYSLTAASWLLLCSALNADEVTAQVQKDLVALGYDPGTISGESDPATTVAIARFEQDRGMKVSGTVSPELADSISAEVSGQRGGAAAQDPQALRSAQEACLQEQIAAAQEAQKKKRGFGKLFNAVARTATKLGSNKVNEVAWDVYDANATYEDLAGAARDLGLTEDQIAACENP